MPRLRILNCGHLSASRIESLKMQLPNLNIDHKFLKIANSNQSVHPKDGFWDIEVKQLHGFGDIETKPLKLYQSELFNEENSSSSDYSEDSKTDSDTDG